MSHPPITAIIGAVAFLAIGAFILFFLIRDAIRQMKNKDEGE